MTFDRAHLELARAALSDREFDVWFAKHYQGLGRRLGSVRLGISEEAWRYRLTAATRKVDEATKAKEGIAT